MKTKKKLATTTAAEEIRFLQHPNALRKHANKVLATAKAVEANLIARGATWKREKGSKTARLTLNN